MQGKRVSILVEVNLDAVPGHFDNVQDYIKLLKTFLDKTVPHYYPSVREVIDEAEYEARASRK